MGFSASVWVLIGVLLIIFIFWARSDHGRTRIMNKLEQDPLWARRRILRKKATNGKPRVAVRRRKTK